MLNETATLTDRWFPIPDKALVHQEQNRLIRDLESSKYSYYTIVGGRRSFKTERFSKRATAIYALHNPNHIILMGAPTISQAKGLLWEDMKSLLNPIFIKKTNETDRRITLRNNATIQIIGLKEFQRQEGQRCHYFAATEWQQCDPKAWSQSIEAMINDTDGKAIFDGRPFEKNHLFDFYQNGIRKKDGWGSYHWTAEEILTPKQIERAKSNLSELDYQREYLASFETGGKTPYHSYSSFNNLTIDWRPNTRPLIVACDFNATIKPMSWVLGQSIIEDGEVATYWKDVIYHQYTNTETACKLLWDKIRDIRFNKIIFYGDYAGTHKTSNSSWSDWQIIENYFKNKLEIELRIKPCLSIRDSIGATNALLRNANRKYRMFVDPLKCQPLIDDWEKCFMKSNGRELDENDDLRGHLNRAIDYYSDMEAPIYSNTKAVEL